MNASGRNEESESEGPEVADKLTKSKALKAYRVACKQFGVEPHGEVVEQGGARWPGMTPVLCKNFEGWYSTTAWAIVWEEGPYDWTMHVESGLVDGVFAEPINGFALGLYRNE